LWVLWSENFDLSHELLEIYVNDTANLD
jgi:hypothetical protein